MGTPAALDPNQPPAVWSRTKATWKGEFWYLKKKISENSCWSLFAFSRLRSCCFGALSLEYLGFEPPILNLGTELYAKKWVSRSSSDLPFRSPKVPHCWSPWCNLHLVYSPMMDMLTFPPTQWGIWNQSLLCKKNVNNQVAELKGHLITR